VTAVLEDKDNHMIDALRYAVEGARRALNSAPRHVRQHPDATGDGALANCSIARDRRAR
jgi:hypothetical protein